MSQSWSASRRALLGGIAALPALGLSRPLFGAAAAEVAASADAKAALNVMEFEALARAALADKPAHFGYIATGADDDRTVAINHDAFAHYEIRSRRFVDVSHVDMSVQVFGTRWPTPVYLSAVSSQRAFHPEGEAATARAAASRSAQLMLSNVASTAQADVIKARGAPIWQQLYATNDWKVTEALVKRAEQLGCPAIALTVDNMPGRNNETLLRAMKADTRVCTTCHANNSHDPLHKAPAYAGLDVSRVTELSPTDMSWAFLDKLRRLVKVKLIVKGIVTGEDAALACEHGVDGIVVSNHGGRDEETLRATIDCLPEVVAAVKGRVPVFIDGGVRRGTDVFKALALGATGVGIGRPQVWGLAAFGQAGVESVLDIYARELKQIMRQAGTPDIRAIDASRVVRKAYA
ncbi:MAG: alpha-hydroxy-acid oxidizing protein [Proteobacteria bacterium]|nr:alpha-hydroxy-acid oxidizing protein [Pseudomonadota bacterium]